MSEEPAMTEDDIMRALETRLGRLHARQRLGIERDHEAQIFGQGLNFFHPENLAASPLLIRAALTIAGLYRRGLGNAENVRLRENTIVSARLPRAFDGYTILHLSDLHVDMCPQAMARVRALVADLTYDLCVLTGDYRGATHGPHEAALAGMAELRDVLRAPILAVLGNHDTIMMTPRLEQMGMRVLLNERETLWREGACLHVAGVDDAHYFRVDNIEKAGEGIPQGEFSILLSHTPEIFRQAAHAGFDILLAGHTHGGQICLPGGVALTLDSALPRAYGAGAWKYHDMQGYTSVGAGSSVLPVRFNCPPEITLHRLMTA
ncbi:MULTISPECIES: metallophosphoesterase [Methylosinus]|nr:MULTISPECIES: metallophosphoesterase [Methylosinus]